MGVDCFEDLIAWQKAREMTALAYLLTRRSPFAGDFALSRQLQRASVSVMSNIAEGFERFRPTEFAHFLSIAKASCGEVRSLLYVASDVGYLDAETFADAMSQAVEVSRITGALRAKVSAQR